MRSIIFCYFGLLIFLSNFSIAADTRDFRRDSRDPTALELWENIRLVHVTDNLKNHTVVPGTSLIITNQFNNPESISTQLRQAIQEDSAPFAISISRDKMSFSFVDVNGLLPEARITSHWNLYNVVEKTVGADSNNVEKNVQLGCERSIAIVEIAKHFKGQLYGGNNEDFMIIGPHVLSRDSFIIAPCSLQNKIEMDNPEYPGTYWFYDDKEYSDIGKAVDAFNQQFKAKNPASWTFTFKKKLASTLDERESMIEDLIELGSFGEKKYAEYDDFIKVMTNFKQRNMLRQMAIHPTLDEFFISKENLIELFWFRVDGKVYYGQHFFSSWINDEKLPWVSHNAHFREIEMTFNKLTEEMRRSIINTVMQPYGFYYPCFTSMQSCDEISELIAKLNMDLDFLAWTITHLSDDTQTYFLEYRRKIDQWVEAAKLNKIAKLHMYFSKHFDRWHLL